MTQKLNTFDSRYSKVSDDYVIQNGTVIDLKTGKTPNIIDSADKTYNKTRMSLRRKDGKGNTSIDYSRLQEKIDLEFRFF